mmetsp:Transcript_118437/g.368125  ORF Transcript_118437/g.368125 Transcript_118437/m.368125 type:complete len:91 (-) Transcript_118437:1126-1398(-)
MGTMDPNLMPRLMAISGAEPRIPQSVKGSQYGHRGSRALLTLVAGSAARLWGGRVLLEPSPQSAAPQKLLQWSAVALVGDACAARRPPPW